MTAADYRERLTAVGITDPDRILTLAARTVRQIRGEEPGTSALEDRWYRSLTAGAPDYGIYDDDDYLAEAWACWQVYSRYYLYCLRRPKGCPPDGVAAALQPVTRLADLGCGIGYSTAALRDLFPGADVYGTQLPGPQADIARTHGVTVHTDVQPDTDVVFASEYFEHFQEPITHLQHVLTAARPRALIIASTFTSPSAGHFPEYVVTEDDTLYGGHRTVPGRTASRLFTEELHRHGFREMPGVNIWNHRPRIWVQP